jgi:serine/threonine protein kinase
MDTDLGSVIRSPQPLSDDHCKYFLYQLLRGLKFIHSANILHRDLKPRNLLVNSNCDLQISNFGLARANLPDLTIKAAIGTDYVANRWYKAPEVLLTYSEYTTAIDVWSVGVIFGELLQREPLFRGHNSEDQCEYIFNLIGTPTEDDIAAVPNPRSKERLLHFTPRRGKAFEMVFEDRNPLAIDLLKKMLRFDPTERITAEEALEHSYLAELHCPGDEPTTSKVSMFDFEFEQREMTEREVKDLIYDEILLHHSQEKLAEYCTAKARFEEKFHAQSLVRPAA